MRSALSIAGSDPTGGAGILADLQVFRGFGVHGAGVVTALTVQDSVKIHRTLPVFPSVVLDQLRVLLRDFQPDAVKIGMLATDDVARNVILGLAELAEDTPVVLDPVLAASDGTPLLERRAWPTLRGMLSRATLVTPNLQEAAALTDSPDESLSSRSDCEAAAQSLIKDLGARNVLIKGGHREGPPDDLLALGEGGEVRLHWLAGERQDGGAVHGTGCALASAIAAQLALGRPLSDAVNAARTFVAQGLSRAQQFGAGARFLVGP